MLKETQKELIECIETVGKQFQDFPWENKVAYIKWLTQTYFFVRHTTSFLALSAVKWGVKNRKQQYAALAHLKEEASHDILLLDDLKSLNFSIETETEWPETQSFYQTQYYWIEHETPAAHLGYAYFLEGLASAHGKKVYERVVKAHQEKAGTFLKIHALEDVKHFEEALERLESLNNDELKAFQQCLRQAALLYSQILAKAKT